MKTNHMRFLKWLGIVILLLILVYFVGPKPTSPTFSPNLPSVPDQPLSIEKYILAKEANHRLKHDNQARIIWFDDSTKAKTEFAIVYLHGFSASQEEGDPIHQHIAKKFGSNLYLSRLEDHGVDTTEPLLTLTADRLWNSAKEAYAIGKQLGHKVILMGTSTGGTLALKLAAEYPDIAGLLLFSPNISIKDPNAWLLNNHWGLQIANMIKGKYNTARDTTALYAKYWNAKYRMESAVQLQELIETTMKESLFKKVKQPLLMLYYFKDDSNQDRVVKVSAMKRMFSQLETPDSLKRQMAIPNAGDHVIGSYVKSKDVASVILHTEKFVKEVLKIKPVME
ncbi:MAG: alpha/beta hydrolase [Chitinophagaceae bacterium]|nr:alpha/beta hydrolase [Chitinophagaceae bacterium]